MRAIAVQHVGDDEGEHAMHLALQLGMGDPAWWAERFVGASERRRAAWSARVVAFPASFALVRCPVDRRLLFEVTEVLLAEERWPSGPWLGELTRTAGPPWNAAERRTIEQRAAAVTAWTDEWDDPPQAVVLQAVGYPPPDGSDQTSRT